MNGRSEVEQVHQDLVPLIESFSERQTEAKEAIKKLMVAERRIFCAAAIRVLAQTALSPGTRYLAQLLSNERLLGPGLLDTVNCRTEEALGAARAAVEAGLPIQNGLEFALKIALQEQPSFANTAKILRALDLLAASAPAGWWDGTQLEVMNYPDNKVRSRAALLIGRCSKSTIC
ncbi:MAG TPA: hypothetical protein VKX49_31330 [Bryobacteraceae bacterium]|nr:hypothetical protein [Bryobacteraceae bacterium]